MSQRVILSTPQGITVMVPQSVGARSWGEELVVALGPGYLGKLLRRMAGTAGDLQFHRQKHETHYLFSGEAELHCDNGAGVLVRHRMTAGHSVSIPPGAVHRVIAITDCIFFESSTPHFEDRVNVSAQYGEADDPNGLPTTVAPLTACEAGIDWPGR